MHEKELVMGILIAATSLLGLSGIFLVYAHGILEKLDAKKIGKNRVLPKRPSDIPKLQNMFTTSYGLSVSIVFGVVAIVLSLLWFTYPCTEQFRIASLWGFVLQLLFFIMTLIATRLLFKRG